MNNEFINPQPDNISKKVISKKILDVPEDFNLNEPIDDYVKAHTRPISNANSKKLRQKLQNKTKDFIDSIENSEERQRLIDMANKIRVDNRKSILDLENQVLSTKKVQRKKSSGIEVNSVNTVNMNAQNGRFLEKVNYVVSSDENSQSIDGLTEIVDIREKAMNNIDEIQTQMDVIPDEKIDTTGLQSDIRQYVAFYKEHLSIRDYKLNYKLDEHGLNLFNSFLHIHKQELLKPNIKLHPAYLIIKPFLTKKHQFV